MNTDWLPADACTAPMVFSKDFSVLDTGGDDDRASDLGLLLSTVQRSLNDVAETLQQGALVGLQLCGEGRAALLNRHDNDWRLIRVKPFADWLECQPEFEGSCPPGTANGIATTDRGLLAVLTSLAVTRWYARRDDDSQDWEFTMVGTEIDEDALQMVALKLMQADILLRTQELPRQRVRYQFEDGNIWVWSTQGDRALMLSTAPLRSTTEMAEIVRTGDQFLLADRLNLNTLLT